jgi:hypothetical protein
MIRMTAGMMWLASALLLAQAPMQAQEFGAAGTPAGKAVEAGYTAARWAQPPCAAAGQSAEAAAARARNASTDSSPGVPSCNH